MSSLQFFSLFDQQISKSEWKEIISNTVHSHIEATWRAEIGAKASLKYVNPDSLKVGKAHPVWATVRNTISDNKRAVYLGRIRVVSVLFPFGRVVSARVISARFPG